MSSAICFNLEQSKIVSSGNGLNTFTMKFCPFYRFPGITKAEEMLNEIYVNQNRNRTRPCVQSRTDIFRVFKYDINSAAEMSNHTQPLLMTRHNVVPGMFLVCFFMPLYRFVHLSVSLFVYKKL